MLTAKESIAVKNNFLWLLTRYSSNFEFCFLLFLMRNKLISDKIYIWLVSV